MTGAARSWARRALLACGAVLIAAFVLGALSGLRAPGRDAVRDAAVEAGKQTLRVLAYLEERRNLRGQGYTENLVLLSTEADDPAKLLAALRKSLVSDSLSLTVSSAAYRISAQAQDADHTRLQIAGPVSAATPQ